MRIKENELNNDVNLIKKYILCRKWADLKNIDAVLEIANIYITTEFLKIIKK